MPNLFVILILYIGLFTNRTLGLTYGVILGIFLDLFIGKKIGITAIMLGSIGIIGIALILAISTGVQNYIDKVEEDTLSSYPITIEEATIDISSMMEAIVGASEENTENQEEKRVY